MKRKKVVVLFGGCSTEYEVSLQSAYSVITNLNPKKYEAILIGITRQGAWLRFFGALEKIRNNTWVDGGDCVPAIISPDRNIHGLLEFHDDRTVTTKIDVAFPVLHGKNGEDGTLQGLLTMAGIPFAGCGTLCSAMCMDKDIAHKIVNLAGIKTPRSIVLRSGFTDAELSKQISCLTFPLFVKPANAGSSFGITKVFQKNELYDAVTVAFQHDNKVIIEEAVDGFEVGCAVLGKESLVIGEVDEIELAHGFFDYTEKYTLKTSKIHMPARIDPDTAKRIKQTASVIYRALDCSGFARVDLFLTPEKEIIFNEVNTIPGFTSHSRYPIMLKGIGITFEQIVDASISLAINS
ncbi:MAG: D-alanine--D-serine ligase VanG [Clostridia bacterium]|nr:D-alanine--D-serine ligase VanG [Clostridia bacterium]